MKLIHDDLPIEGVETDNGSIKFEFEGYVYYIGQLEGPPGWFSRQTVDDYENGRDNWQKPSEWVDENKTPNFKFLSKI